MHSASYQNLQLQMLMVPKVNTLQDPQLHTVFIRKISAQNRHLYCHNIKHQFHNLNNKERIKETKHQMKTPMYYK